MNKNKAELTAWYIYHSGTAVFNHRTKSLHIFDFYRQEGKDFPGVWQEEISAENTYIYVSHGHGDHFNSEIFSWSDRLPAVRYILSHDLKTKRSIPGSDDIDIYYMKPGDALNLHNIKLNAHPSTDEGVSFMIREGNAGIFHAGDLNWWDWKSFSAAERKQEEKEFKDAVNQLEKYRIDLAFVPVDPRLEESFYLAGEHFIKTINPSVFIPIHWQNNFDIVSRFKGKIDTGSTRVPEINRPGQKIHIH